MKIFLFLAILFTTSIVWSQHTWVEVFPEDNPVFFELGKNNMFENVKQLILDKKLDVYREKTTSGSHYESGLSKVWSLEQIKEEVFLVTIVSWTPLVDSLGEPILKINEDGTQEYTYPEPEVHELTNEWISSLRIKEKYIGEDKVVEAIGFVVQYSDNDKRARMWVKMNGLQQVAGDKPWLKALQQLDYKGFQYMQSPN